MQLIKQLLGWKNALIPHHALVGMLSDYSQPNDKIHQLMKQGVLLPVKRGLYVLHADFSGARPNPVQVANLLYGPSYVSFEYALSWHGAIPERVITITSATVKPSKTIDHALGHFSFTHLPLPYYSLGIRSTSLENNLFGLIASPEKALIDKIVATSGLQFRSHAAVREYLLEDLRIDEDWLQQLDHQEMASWLPYMPKSQSIALLIKNISKL
jgi:predicted transcriptional regulator of viral defense system